MRYLFWVFLTLLPQTSQAETVEAAWKAMVGNCQQDGGTSRYCTCLFETWHGFIPEGRRAEAYAIAHVFSETVTPTADERAAAMPFVPALNQADAQCSNVAEFDFEETLRGIPMQNFDTLPHEQQAQMLAIIEAAQNGDTAALMGMASKDQSEPEEQDLVIDYASLAKQETSRIENEGPPTLAFNDYEQVFTLWCLADELAPETCGCAWDAVKLADQGQNDLAFAYMVSTPAGGDLMAHFSQNGVQAAITKMQQYTEARQACF